MSLAAHADDRVGAPVQHERPADDLRVAAEALLPVRRAEHHDRRPPRRSSSAVKLRPTTGFMSSDREEGRRHHRQLHALGLALAGQVEAFAPERGHARERLAARGSSRGSSDRTTTCAGTAAPSCRDEQAVGFGERQAAQQHAVDEAEHRRVGADAERQRQHGDVVKPGDFCRTRRPYRKSDSMGTPEVGYETTDYGLQTTGRNACSAGLPCRRG